VTIEDKLTSMKLRLPEPPKVPPGVRLPFSFVRVHGDRAFIAGHSAQYLDGSLAGPFGKVGGDVSPDAAYDAARLTAVSMIASLKRELGELSRIDRWLRVFGMVNGAPDFNEFPAVINGCSDLILELWGEEAGQHVRSAIGVAGLPWNFCVEIEAEVALK